MYDLFAGINNHIQFAAVADMIHMILFDAVSKNRGLMIANGDINGNSLAFSGYFDIFHRFREFYLKRGGLVGMYPHDTCLLRHNL